jgi:cytoskeletal protein RodZ
MSESLLRPLLAVLFVVLLVVAGCLLWKEVAAQRTNPGRRPLPHHMTPTSGPDVPDWVLRNLRATIRCHTQSAIGNALRTMAREFDADGVDPNIVDRIRRQAERTDGIRVVRMPPSDPT